MDVFNKIHILYLYSCIKRALLHLLFFVCECVFALQIRCFSLFFLSNLKSEIIWSNTKTKTNVETSKLNGRVYNTHARPTTWKSLAAGSLVHLLVCSFVCSCFFYYSLFQQQNNKIVGNIIIDMLGPRYLYIFQNERAMPMCMWVCLCRAAPQRTQSN